MLGELTENQIARVLHSHFIGRIGCYAEDELYIVPVTYAYDKGYIYAHSREGRKVRMMRKNPTVCFQIDSMENMNNWRSVIAWGEYEELDSEKDREAALKILEDRFKPFLTSESVHPFHGSAHPPEIVEKTRKAVIYRIRITRSTGRFEKTG